MPAPGAAGEVRLLAAPPQVAGAEPAPLALRFFFNGDLIGWVLGLCVVVFMVFSGLANLRSQRTLSDALVMRFEREAIAAELAEENTRREAHEVEMKEARDKAESAARPAEAEAPARSDSDLDALKRQLDDVQKRLDKMSSDKG